MMLWSELQAATDETYLVTCLSFVGIALTIAGVSIWRTCYRSRITQESERIATDLKNLQIKYLWVYGFAVLADWLQGPYFYAVYEGYGYDQFWVNCFFVVGFLSSAIFGTVAGTMADRLGRRRLAIVYFLSYAVSVGLAHIGWFSCLIAGRILGGIATSLLFCTFDAWIVCAHGEANLPAEHLQDTFRHAQLLNSICAIIAGLVAQAGVNAFPAKVSIPFHYGGNLVPFMMAAGVLLIGAALATVTWEENDMQRVSQQRTVAMQPLLDSASPRIAARYGGIGYKIWCLGGISCLFEASMYCFVIQWTPALDAGVPLGLVFSALMAGCMVGSQVFGVLTKVLGVELILVCVMLSSCVFLLVPAFVTESVPRFFLFVCFEVCVGAYWPSIGTLKAKYVPEASRASVYSIFRIPLNLLVTIVLISDLGENTFVACAGLLGLGAIGSLVLAMGIRSEQSATLGLVHLAVGSELSDLSNK